MVVTKQLTRHVQRIRSVALIFSGLANQIVVQTAYRIPRVDIPLCGEQGIAQVPQLACRNSDDFCSFVANICVWNHR